MVTRCSRSLRIRLGEVQVHTTHRPSVSSASTLDRAWPSYMSSGGSLVSISHTAHAAVVRIPLRRDLSGCSTPTCRRRVVPDGQSRLSSHRRASHAQSQSRIPGGRRTRPVARTAAKRKRWRGIAGRCGSHSRQRFGARRHARRSSSGPPGDQAREASRGCSCVRRFVLRPHPSRLPERCAARPRSLSRGRSRANPSSASPSLEARSPARYSARARRACPCTGGEPALAVRVSRGLMFFWVQVSNQVL